MVRSLLSGARLLGFLTIVLFAAPNHSTAVPTDLDGDGRSELVVVTANNTGALSFIATDTDSGAQTNIGAVGNLGDHIALGHWTSTSSLQPAVVQDGTDSLLWSLGGEGDGASEARFGTRSETIITGGDLDGDGLLDAVTTGGAARKRSWKIARNLFGPERSEVEVSFGFIKERPIYIHGDGRDLLATLSIGVRGVTALRTFDFVTGKIRRIRLARAPVGITPLPIRYSPTTAGLVYLVPSSSGTTIHYHQLNARAAVVEGFIPTTGTAVVGDFLSEEGEEIAIHTGNKLYIHSRAQNELREVEVPEGIAIDEVNINSFVPNTPPTTSPAPPTETPTTPADPSLASVCASISPILPGEMLIKSDPSSHIGRHDPRTLGYTVVCARECPANLSFTQFFYANGEFAGAVAKYGLFSGNGRPRLYGAVGQALQHDAREIAAKAKTIGNGKLYLQVSSSTSGEGTKCKEFSPQGRNGSL